MKIYNYDAFTNEFLSEEDAVSDPLEKDKFLLPAFATFTPVIPEKQGFARCFISSAWEYFKDLRGLKQLEFKTLNISVVKNFGELKAGFYLISEEEINELQKGKIAAIEGGVLILKDRPLTELKEDKKQEINSWRETARDVEGVEYNDDLFDIDQKSQANITAIVSILIANNVTDTYKTVYRSKTNKDHELTKAQMVELGTAIGAKVSEIYKKSWELKEKVDSATSKEEVEVIKWNM